MIVVDTTVLVYAVGADHALAAPCRELVRRVGEEQLRATTTVEVLQEFAHVRARRLGRPDAVELTRQYHTLFSPFCGSDPTTWTRGSTSSSATTRWVPSTRCSRARRDEPEQRRW